MAKCVWVLQGEPVLEFLSQAQHEDARGWLHDAVANLRHEDLVRLTVVMWAIWYARRKVIHEEMFQSPLSTHNFIERFLSDLETTTPTEVKQRQGERIRSQVTRWIPPPRGVLKVNIDAALSKNSDIAAMAAMARDETGIFLGASALVVEGITSPEVAEAMACREGLALASDLDLQKIRISTDCVNVVKNIYGQGMGLYGHIVMEIKAGAARFVDAQFIHEGRNSNGDAHRLARSSIFEAVGRHVWLLTPPDGVCTN